MQKCFIIFGGLILLFHFYGQVDAREGFYKDLFMDGGVNLTSRTTLPVADALNLSMEFLATSESTLQRQIFIENSHDKNGLLLYPDGAPRYAMIYTNGGSATNHGKSLGEAGRNRVRTHYLNGGSYCGSCAGAFIASLSYMSSGIYEPYYHIWPGRTAVTGIEDTYTGHFITDDSPLLDYFSFGGDQYIASVYHNGGAYARENLDYPQDTEILLRYDYPGTSIHQKASCWAYKKDVNSGRLVVIGSHPEGVTYGERLDLMKAMFKYALAAIGDPEPKDILVNGEKRMMDKFSDENDPDFCRIGDMQYHHYKLLIPENGKNLSINLESDDGFDMHLYLLKNEPAFADNAEFWQTAPGGNKQLIIDDVTPGNWYLSVKCATTVETERQSWGYSYGGPLEVLDGVAYNIAASWDTIATGIADQNLHPQTHTLQQNYPNPFNSMTTIKYEVGYGGSSDPGERAYGNTHQHVTITIYNPNGQKISTLVSEYRIPGAYQVNWDAGQFSSGVYLYILQIDGKLIDSKRTVLIK